MGPQLGGPDGLGGFMVTGLILGDRIGPVLVCLSGEASSTV